MAVVSAAHGSCKFLWPRIAPALCSDDVVVGRKSSKSVAGVACERESNDKKTEEVSTTANGAKDMVRSVGIFECSEKRKVTKLCDRNDC